MSQHHPRPVFYAVWLIFVSAVGWFAAFQLLIEKIAKLEDPDAVSNCYVSVMIQCTRNLDSWQGEIFGFPNPIIGLTLWMAPLVVGAALLAGARFPRWFWLSFGTGITFAFGFVLWLISQSLYAPNLGVLCPWCMATWAVTIPTFFATVVHLTRNGTVTGNKKVQERANRLMPWVPLVTILTYAFIIVLVQLRGLDLLGEVIGMIL